MSVTIELGEVHEAPEPATGPPGGLRRWRWAAAVVAGVAVLAAGGAERVRDDLVEVTAPAGNYAFSDPDGVYLVSGNTFMKYEMPSVRPLWRVTVPMDGRPLGGFLSGGTLLIVGRGLDPQTVALDTATGQIRWRRAGEPVSYGDGVVLLSYQSFGDIPKRYEAVDLGTGSARWSVVDPDDAPTYFGGGRLVRWTPRRTEVRDLGTGRVLASGVLPRPAPGDSHTPDGRQTNMVLAGDVILVGRESGGALVADAYDPDRLVRRWTADIDMRFEHVTDCGDALCVVRSNGSGARVLDAATGRVRWSSERPTMLERVGPALLSYEFTRQPPSLQLLDPADGHVRADLGRWDVNLPDRDARRVLATRPNPAGGVLVAELDLERGRVRVLGSTGEAFNCQAGWTSVVCGASGAGTRIWYARPE